MIQAYEYEFSRITRKTPLPDGTMPLDTVLGGNVRGWIWWRDGHPAGLAAVIDHGDHREVAEFYVVPRWRGQGQGRELAARTFDAAPGRWVVKQLAAAHDAQAFWKRCLAALPCRNLSESEFSDPYWGQVLRQEFDWPGDRSPDA
jgi:predicted acetyltransferase